MATTTAEIAKALGEALSLPVEGDRVVMTAEPSTPPPPAKDAAEGTLGGKDWQHRITPPPRGQSEPPRNHVAAERWLRDTLERNVEHVNYVSSTYLAKYGCYNTGVFRRSGQETWFNFAPDIAEGRDIDALRKTVEESIGWVGGAAIEAQGNAGARAIREMSHLAAQAWINTELSILFRSDFSVVGLSATYNADSDCYRALVGRVSAPDDVYEIPSTIAHTRDSEGLRGIVQPGATGRFDAGHLAAYHAALGITDQDYRDALGITSMPYPVDGKDGGTWVPVGDATVAHDSRHVYRTEAYDIATQAAAIRAMAQDRVRARYAVCDWDDPVRQSDAEDYVLGELGLVARVEKDFSLLAILGPTFRETRGDAVRRIERAKG